MADVTAQWLIGLTCVCPSCKEYVDLLEYPYFWDGRRLEVPEHGTDRSRDLEVICPKCEHEFEVDCEY